MDKQIKVLLIVILTIVMAFLVWVAIDKMRVPPTPIPTATSSFGWFGDRVEWEPGIDELGFEPVAKESYTKQIPWHSWGETVTVIEGDITYLVEIDGDRSIVAPGLRIDEMFEYADENFFSVLFDIDLYCETDSCYNSIEVIKEVNTK